MGDRDLLREARDRLSRLPRILGSAPINISALYGLLDRIDATLDAPPEPCPACEARARTELEYGWGVVDREGKPAPAGDPLVASDYSHLSPEELDEWDPDRAPHRVVRLAGLPVEEGGGDGE